MTISEPTYLKKVYSMNGVATLPFAFPAAQSSDLRVYSYDTVNGTETLLTETTDYTVAFTDATLPSAGSVTLLDSALYNDTDFEVTLTRDTEAVQEYDMEFGQKMDPTQLEFEQDRQVMMIQDEQQVLNEVVRFPSSEEVTSGANILPTKANRANSVLAFDENSNFTTSTTILDAAVADATAAADASATAAALSETNAAISETNAATSASNAATSESNAATSETNAAASAASIPSFGASVLDTPTLGDGSGGFTNALYTLPRQFSAGDIGKLLSITATGVVSQVDAPSGGGWSATSDKTGNYTVLVSEDGTKFNLTTGASADATFTLPTAGLTDGLTFWFVNENAFATYRLTISDGTDDIIYLGVNDGVAEVFYDADTTRWTAR